MARGPCFARSNTTGLTAIPMAAAPRMKANSLAVFTCGSFEALRSPESLTRKRAARSASQSDTSSSGKLASRRDRGSVAWLSTNRPKSSSAVLSDCVVLSLAYLLSTPGLRWAVQPSSNSAMSAEDSQSAGFMLIVSMVMPSGRTQSIARIPTCGKGSGAVERERDRNLRRRLSRAVVTCRLVHLLADGQEDLRQVIDRCDHAVVELAEVIEVEPGRPQGPVPHEFLDDLDRPHH